MPKAALVAILATLPLVALAADGRRGHKERVEIVNDDPIAVEVMNPAPPSLHPARFQFVGFTAQIYTGELSGLFGAALKCQVEFASSRMCELVEFQETTVIPPVSQSAIGWVNLSDGKALRTGDGPRQRTGDLAPREPRSSPTASRRSTCPGR